MLGLAQEKNAPEEEKMPRWKYQPNFLVGFDVMNAGIAAFSERKLFQGFVSSKIVGNIHAVADTGFEKNTYQKNGYDAMASGVFAKIGGFYMLVKDPENEFNGFYGGAKLAGSFYKQEYFAIPVRGYGGNSATIALPSSSQSSFWVEGNLGGRVQFFNSRFFIDVNAQPRFLAFTTKQEELIPMIVPGFGNSSSKFNLGFAWSVAYLF